MKPQNAIRKFIYFFSLTTSLHLISIFSYASDSIPNKQNITDTITRIDAILELSEQKIDIAEVRLIIEKEIYPNINIKQGLLAIENILKIIKNMPEYGDTSLQKMGTILRYLYTPGTWNNYQAYEYDLDDPFGKKRPHSRSIFHYTATRKGNCVSMPILTTILGQRLGVNINLSTAPLHLFARYTDDKNIITNIESTSGTLLSNKTYIKSFTIHSDAISNGIYLQSLTKKETIAVFLRDLGRYHMHNGKYVKAHLIANLMLKHYPKYVDAIILKGNIFSKRLSQNLTMLKINKQPITPAIKERLDYLLEQNLALFAKAESLGWRERTPDFNEKYLQSIKRFRARKK